MLKFKKNNNKKKKEKKMEEEKKKEKDLGIVLLTSLIVCYIIMVFWST